MLIRKARHPGFWHPRKQPLGSVELDHGHPLLRGCVAYWLCSDPALRDRMGHGLDAVIGSAGMNVAPGGRGVVQTKDLATAASIAAPTGSPLDIAATGGAIAGGFTLVTPPGQNVLTAILGRQNVPNTASPPVWSLGIRGGGGGAEGTEAYRANLAQGTTSQSITGSGPAPLVNEAHHAALYWNGATVGIAADGVTHVETAQTVTDFGAYQGLSAYIGASGSTSFFYSSNPGGAVIHWAAVFDFPGGDIDFEQLRVLTAEPYSVLRPRIRRSYSIPATGGGTTVSVAVTGVSATGSVGDPSVSFDSTATLTGVSGTGSVGSVDISTGGNATVAVDGVSATGSVGTLALAADASPALTGVAGTGHAGSVTTSSATNASVAVTGVAATGHVGSLTLATSSEISVTGVSATGQVGSVTITGAVAEIWTAVSPASGTWSAIPKASGTWTAA